MRNLHRGRIRVTIGRDHFDAEALRLDDDFLPSSPAPSISRRVAEGRRRADRWHATNYLPVPAGLSIGASAVGPVLEAAKVDDALVAEVLQRLPLSAARPPTQ